MVGKMNGILLGFALVLMMQFAAAGVQLSSSSITPSVIKPGMTGTINIVLNNPSTTEFITAAYINPSATGVSFSGDTKIGDLGGLGTTSIAIPFRVSQTASPGTIPVKLQLTYTSGDSTGTQYKTFSIPLTISATNLLSISNIVKSQETVYPGDTFTIEATIENEGGAIRNAVLSYSSSSSYTFDGTTKLDVGDIDAGEKKRIKIPIMAGDSISAGYYSIPFILTFDDAVAAGNTEELLFGPITAVADYEKFAISADAVDATPGGKGTFKISVRNTGANEIRNFKVTLPPNVSFFTPLDFPEKTIDTLKPGEQKELSFDVGIGTNIAAQVYPLPLTISYQTKSGSETKVKTVGVKIGGAPDLSIYLSSNPSVISNDNKPYSISIQVSNTGNSAVRALSVNVKSNEMEILSPSRQYIGTLNLDDYSTVQYDMLVKKSTAPGKYKMEVELTYKDSYNQLRTDSKTVEFEVFSQDIALIASKQTGSNPLMMIVIVIAIILAVYFGYKRFFKSPASQKFKLK